ncbi:uncharacterized protein LOC110044119 [Orbicella faveolata]|uniref:uncharacterized protein LOC110044119 n=1 Tax=Orbicella faveolata TaxID=48498 RepID=UPI0009E5C704|nr:uncharacterized protein LOC110044119 [Orbicella faveolata]
MGSFTSRDVPPTDNQASTSDGYEDEDPPTDEETVNSARHDDYEERVSPTYNEVVGNFPETADLLLPRHNPLEHKNWENLRREDEKNWKRTRPKGENENERENSQNTNVKVQAPSSAMSRS